MAGDDNRFTPGEIERALARIEKDVGDIKKAMDTRLSVLEKDSATHCADIDWLKRGFWILTGVGLSALVSAIFSLISKTGGG